MYVLQRLPSETIIVTEYCPTSRIPGLILSIFGRVNVIKVGPPVYNDIVVGLDSASVHDGRAQVKGEPAGTNQGTGVVMKTGAVLTGVVVGP